MSHPCGQIAQLVEQRTENPRVGGSIPPLATRLKSISCKNKIRISLKSALSLGFSKISGFFRKKPKKPNEFNHFGNKSTV